MNPPLVGDSTVQYFELMRHRTTNCNDENVDKTPSIDCNFAPNIKSHGEEGMIRYVIVPSSQEAGVVIRLKDAMT